jgi:hypothetical protein
MGLKDLMVTKMKLILACCRLSKARFPVTGRVPRGSTPINSLSRKCFSALAGRIRLTALTTATLIACCAPPLGAQSAFNINLDSIRSSVVFMHFRDPNGVLKEAGTGFMLAAPSKTLPGRSYYLLVTARHIVDPGWANCPALAGTLFAVFNTKGDGAQPPGATEIALNPAWMYPSEDSADVAVTILNAPALEQMRIENQPLNLSVVPTLAEASKVDTGAPIISAGLLLGASGVRRNYPIFKFGYVSSKPDEQVSVSCVKGGVEKYMTEWMIAASLVAGNSGSPIYFVPPGIPGVVSGAQKPFLLGVQSMSFEGSDVAGMTPVNYLLEAIRRLPMPDIDLDRFGADLKGPPAAPTSVHPQPVPIPVPTPR